MRYIYIFEGSEPKVIRRELTDDELQAAVEGYADVIRVDDLHIHDGKEWRPLRETE